MDHIADSGTRQNRITVRENVLDEHITYHNKNLEDLQDVDLTQAFLDLNAQQTAVLVARGHVRVRLKGHQRPGRGQLGQERHGQAVQSRFLLRVPAGAGGGGRELVRILAPTLRRRPTAPSWSAPQRAPGLAVGAGILAARMLYVNDGDTVTVALEKGGRRGQAREEDKEQRQGVNAPGQYPPRHQRAFSFRRKPP